MTQTRSAPDAPYEGWQSLLARRVVLVTGKGGVGRSTVTAAMARAAAKRGRRVLVAEIGEPAEQTDSTLARLFGRQVLDASVCRLEDGVCGVMLQSEYGTRRFLSSVFKVEALARLALRTPVLLRFLHAAPSLHEMGIFYHLLDLLRARRPGVDDPLYDFILLDMPATGHTLALTGLPRILLKLVRSGPIADALREGQAVLNDGRRSVACVVTLPEPLPVSEALELVEGLKDTDVTVGGVVVNKVPADPFSPEERALLGKMLEGRSVLGTVELSRIDRAGESLDRLARELLVPMATLPELILDERALVDQLSEGLAAVE